jgi:aspartate racemase
MRISGISADLLWRVFVGHDAGMTRILGIVGGTGPESTVDYYRSIIAIWQRRVDDGSYPRLIINSVEAGQIFRDLAEGDHVAIAAAIVPALEQLAAAGVGAALLASNATHLAFDEIAPASPVPLIHIVDAATEAAVTEGYRRLGIFGTRFVMEAPMYPERFGARGITVVVPTLDEREHIHGRYFGELVRGVFLDETRNGLVEIIARMRDRDGIDGLILGGTELSLILTKPSYAGVPILNTAKIHAEAAVDWLLSGNHD